MKRLLAIGLFTCSLFAQGVYTAEYKATGLSSAASVVTVQLGNITTIKAVYLQSAAVYCSVACEITLERDGTQATGTALTPTATRSGSPTVKATAWRSSDAGVGTVLARYLIPAGGTLLLELEDIVLVPQRILENFTVRTAAISGNAIIVVKWKEI